MNVLPFFFFSFGEVINDLADNRRGQHNSFGL